MTKYNFNCPFRKEHETCNQCSRNGLLLYSTSDPEETICCTNSGETLHTDSISTFPKTITKTTITKERETRATKDFRNNVLPSMKPGDRQSWLKSRGEKT